MSGFVSISPAILHGGVTTFLALILLAFSESYPFITFFKAWLPDGDGQIF